MAGKFDGVIEAVRYKNKQIILVRAYERRGATFSDSVLIDRKTLLDRLRQGKQFVVGTRERLRASTFKLGQNVLLVRENDNEWIATRSDAAMDSLEGTPLL